MNNNLPIANMALQDPKLEGVDCICRSNYPGLVDIVEGLPSGAYVSEWRYGMGETRYEYRVHQDGIGEQLRKAFESGVRFGHPWLTAVYTKDELKKLIQQP